MKTLRNIGCFLIGWDKKILSECGEVSGSIANFYQPLAL